MKKITIGQLKDLSNEDNYDITRVLIEPVISSFLFQKDDFQIVPTDQFIAELVDRCSIGQKKLLTQWGIIEPEPELIKLQVGSYIYHPKEGVMEITTGLWGGDRKVYTIKKKHESPCLLVHGESIHKESTYATPEQIAAFKCPWNEGIEEAKKYKDGQPCLVYDESMYAWWLRYSDGNGGFYAFGRGGGEQTFRNRHMPLNEQTIKNLPVNE